MEISLVCWAQWVVKENIHSIYFYYSKIAAYISQCLKNNRKLDFFFSTLLDIPILFHYAFFFFFGISLRAVSPGSDALLSEELRLLICVTPVIISKQADSFNKPFLQGKRELYFTDPEGKPASPCPPHPACVWRCWISNCCSQSLQNIPQCLETQTSESPSSTSSSPGCACLLASLFPLFFIGNAVYASLQ